MQPTTEGSKLFNFDIVCMSFGKEKEKGINVVQGAVKTSIFNDNIELKVEEGKLKDNDTIETLNGEIIKLKKGSYKTIKQNRKMKKEKGIILNYEEKKEGKSNIDRVI